MTDDKIEQLKNDYMQGSTYKELQDKYSIAPNELKWIIQKNSWKRKSNRRNAQKGNKNAKGNKGGTGAKKGNKNAVTTGEYETILFSTMSDEEKKLYQEYQFKDKKVELENEIKMLTIREIRIMKKIQELQAKKKEMTVESITKRQLNAIGDDETEISTHATNTLNLLQKLEDALTRIQDQKRRYIDSLHKIQTEDRKLELDLIRLEREAMKDGSTENEDTIDNSFIEALQDSVESTWDDYEQEESTE